MKSTRKSLLASGLALLVSVALLAGTTFAWFTDSVTNSGNKIQAGRLKIALSELNDQKQYEAVGEAPIFNYNRWEPGYSEMTALKVSNEGSLALKYRLDIVAKGMAANADVQLAEVIDVYAKIETQAILSMPESLEAALQDGYTKVGTLAQLIADGDGAAYGVLYPANAEGLQTAAYAGLILHMQETADNRYQKAAVGTSFDVVLNAAQYTYETDGFDNSTYDQDAPYAWTGRADEEELEESTNPDEKTVTISTPEALAAFAQAVNKGTSYKGYTVRLTDDLNLGNQAWTPIGKSGSAFEGTFDGQGHTISNLLVKRPSSSDVGLFGFTQSGELKNFTLHNAVVKGYLDVGAIAGTPHTSKMTNIKLTGKVQIDGYAYVGGMFGKNAYANLTGLTIDVTEDSYVRGESENYRTYVGGVVGFMGEGGHVVSDVTSNMDVYGSTCDVGGITGIAHYGNSFVNCTSSGEVYLTAPQDDGDQYEIGGIAGVWMNSKAGNVTLRGCSFTGTLHATFQGEDISDELTGNMLTGNKYNRNSNDGQLIIE